MTGSGLSVLSHDHIHSRRLHSSALKRQPEQAGKATMHPHSAETRQKNTTTCLQASRFQGCSSVFTPIFFSLHFPLSIFPSDDVPTLDPSCCVSGKKKSHAGPRYLSCHFEYSHSWCSEVPNNNPGLNLGPRTVRALLPLQGGSFHNTPGLQHPDTFHNLRLRDPTPGCTIFSSSPSLVPSSSPSSAAGSSLRKILQPKMNC